MRKLGGYVTITNPTPSRANLGGLGVIELREGVIELDTIQCGHCQQHIHIPARAHPNFFSMCRTCMRTVCEKCSGLSCDPIEKKIERWEERDRTLKSYGV